MTTPTPPHGPDDLDTRLRESLHRGADTLPYTLDLSGPAIVRARGIRRRRLAVTGAALVALAVVTVPVGLRAGDGLTGGAVAPAGTEVDGPARLRIDLEQLPEGGRPQVPFAQNGVFELAGGAGTADFQALDFIGAEAYGEWVAVTAFDGNLLRLYRFDNSGQRAAEVLVESGAESTVASADHRWLAYVDAGEGGAAGSITVVDTETGRTDTHGLTGRSAELLAVVDGRVYWRSVGAGRSVTEMWSAIDGSSSYRHESVMVSDDGRLAGVVTVRSDYGNCHALLEVESGDRRWSTCDWTPESVSPDGRFVYATPAYADGYGPVEVAVLDAATGEVLRRLELTADPGQGGFFMDARWEGDQTLLLQAEALGQAALVRLDVVTGEVGSAMPPVEYAGIEDPGSPPYILG